MTFAITICSLLTLSYLLLLLAYWYGWARQQLFTLPVGYEPATFISVIIPARNERHNIGPCLASVLAQQYPAGLFEIIVVDDHSEDGTADVVKQYAAGNVRCISLAEHMAADRETVAYKKAALSAGIAQSKGTLIVTTDADCTAGPGWLRRLAAMYEQNAPLMIVAPVIYNAKKRIVEIFQLIDFMSMQGITAAALQLGLGNMSNGANLAFTRAAFSRVNGYQGVDHLASGDDYLLMMKVSRLSPGSIVYLKSSKAIVHTAPQPGWGSFLQQRVRWASKSGKYDDKRLTCILLLVYLFNLSFIVLLVAGFFRPLLFSLAGGMFVVKVAVEYLFLRPVADFFGQKWVLKYFPFLQPLHVLYIVLAGFLGFMGGYKWKGRSVR